MFANVVGTLGDEAFLGWGCGTTVVGRGMVTPLEVKGWIWLFHVWFWVIFVVGIVEKCHLIAGLLDIVRCLVQKLVNLVGVPAALWLANWRRRFRRRVRTRTERRSCGGRS